MKNKRNLQNLFWVTLLALLIGLSCGEEDPVRRPERRKSPDKEVTNSHPSNSEGNKNVAESNKMTNISNNNSTPIPTAPVDKSSFYSVLEANLNQRGLKKSDIFDENNPVEKRILHEYGALFLTTSATPPPTCMFKSADAVNSFQSKVGVTSQNIGGTTVELQPSAMKALLEAREEAKSSGLDITPRDGAEAARRNFDKTLELWNSRFNPACEHWKKKGKLTDEQIKQLKSLPINEQVKEVLELEKGGIYFNTRFDATILSSVAAPGTSPHLSMFAFDVTEFNNPKVRKILGNHGWFRTIKGDAPHFTFLGVKEDDLKNMGLQMVETKDGEFWIPNV